MNRLLGIGAVAAVVVGFLSFKKVDFKLAAEGETDVEQTLSMFGLTVAEVVEQNLAYKSKKPYGTAQVVIDKYTGELYHRIYDKGAGSLGREDYLHNSYGAYASQLKNFNKWVRLINSHSRGGSSGPDGRCVFIVSLLINRETGEVLRSHQGVESKNAESKKLPPVEKAIDTGIASGATMEGLETLLAADGKKRKTGFRKCSKCGDTGHNAPKCVNPQYYEALARKEEMLKEVDYAIRSFTSDAKDYSEQGDYDLARMVRSDATDMKKLKRMIENNHFGKAWWFAFGLDSSPRELAPGAFWDIWDAESFSAEEPSVYYWVKEEMGKRQPLTDADIDHLLEMVRKSVPLPEIEEGMNQAQNLGDEVTWFILTIAHKSRSGDLTTQERFVERYQADYPTTKKPNCKCGAILEWDNLRKAWYCISCPFNTYKAEMDEKAILCPHCEDAEATEICEWCKGKECKECFKEHMTDCNYCEGEGEIPRSWVSDSGDRWSPPSLDVTDWEMCEYCNEGQVCGDEYIPEFSWDAESFSAEVFETLLAAESIRWDRGHRAKSEDYWLYHGFNQDNFSATEVGLGDWCGRKLYYTGHQLKHYLCDCNALAGFHHPTEVVLSANNPKRLPEPQSPKMVEYGPLFVDEFMVESESFEAAKPSKWAGWCPKCNKWRTKQMSYAPDPYYVSRRADPDSLPTGVMLCAKKVRRGGYWKDEEGISHKCDTPLSKKQGGAGGDVPYNPPPFNPDARRLQRAESFSAAEGERCYKCKTTQGKMYWHGKKGLICAICSEGGVKYRAESFEARGGYERKEKSIYHECWKCSHKTEPKWMVRQQDRKCPKCKDEVWADVQTMIAYEDFEATRARRKQEQLEKYRKVFEESGLADWEERWEKHKKKYGAESFSAESDGDKQLDESKKRTKMSAIRTGLAITTFSIVMWNLWTNKKQQKDIADIMALV